MGGAGLIGLFFAVVVIVALVVALVVLVPWGGREERRGDETTLAAPDTLAYAVPPGQDAATVVASLRSAGLDAAPAVRRGKDVVVVAAGADDGVRHRARLAIADTPLVNEGDSPKADVGAVRFTDE